MTTLYDKYGGFATVSKLVQTFYAKVAESEELAPYFSGINMQRLMDHQTKFFSEILGGPVTYTGNELKIVHAAMAITPKAFAEVADLLEEALEDMNIGDDDIETIMEIVDGLKSDIISSDNK
ncbi:MAG: group 1 truncated hemoglobin [Gammaproteobacteria bacterium]|jgi:hemoglobin|nr:group 1 truncated hemoglobin [Gammaproteobacteria bacterium]MBT4146340.1 group 1 truncated hemoglobin [Gammaproteobacteria bacterium]MBT5222545.1 group 1 truncated hemoglobin [Gammaproteobacteria bacterium]MBT5825309.1 group 1 truncated hemoglobin [Gammaproteobacteria bacterium]MBT6420926.1 group 1 truncated hemoglobin [Gammaproteobacteria bacterium]